MEQITEWYNSLDERDQKITLIALVGLVMFLIYFVLLSPLNGSVDDLKTKVLSQQKTVDWMKQQITLIRGSDSASGQSQSSLPLASIVNSTTSAHSLPVSRRDSKSPNEMQVWFDNIPFNSFLRWAAEIKSKHGVKILTANIRSRERDGITSISVKLLK